MDLPWAGCAVTLVLHVRKFFCTHPTCMRRIFVERLPQVVAPSARRTTRLQRVIQAVALALGGEGGARLLTVLGIRLSSATLLNTIRATPPRASATPRGLGIDDWSWRRGHRFGTILVDLEQHTVIDLLPDRSVTTVSDWLIQYPDIEVIARDRAGCYAEAAAKAAPQALQVADRWHLLHNLVEVLEQFLLNHRAALRQATSLSDGTDPPHVADESTPGPRSPNRLRCAQQRLRNERSQRHERIVALYETIRRLHLAGADVRDIARRVGVTPRTVYRYRHLKQPPEQRVPHLPRRRLLDPYEPYLHQRWNEGCHNGMRLYREICRQGYTYGASNVMRFFAQLRRDEANGLPANERQRTKVTPTPTARHVAALFLRRPHDLTAEERDYLARLQRADDTVASAYHMTQTFAAMVRERGGERLDDWLAAVDTCAVAALQRFAKGLRADLPAVRAGLTEVWSNGPTEGFVHKLKLVKRQGYGRSGFAVLRQRVLRAV